MIETFNLLNHPGFEFPGWKSVRHAIRFLHGTLADDENGMSAADRDAVKKILYDAECNIEQFPMMGNDVDGDREENELVWWV